MGNASVRRGESNTGAKVPKEGRSSYERNRLRIHGSINLDAEGLVSTYRIVSGGFLYDDRC